MQRLNGVSRLVSLLEATECRDPQGCVDDGLGEGLSAYLMGFLPPGIKSLGVSQHAWGTSERFSNGVFLCRGTDGYSSRHRHWHHDNLIRVLQGTLDVECNGSWYRLETNGSIKVPHGCPHRLVVVEPCLFSETYDAPYGAPDPKTDIDRMDQGSSEHWRP